MDLMAPNNEVSTTRYPQVVLTAFSALIALRV